MIDSDQDEDGSYDRFAPHPMDFDSDEPLVCNRDQSGDEPCESCQ
jgi:hypothetical protein